MPDLWDEICTAAEQLAAARKPKRAGLRPSASSPAAQRTEAAALERAVIETLCGGIAAQWSTDAQIFILHHWHCQSCGAEGTFPNIETGRLVRRHNRAGTTWTCHDPHADGSVGTLPRKFQHHHHPVAWCQHCVQETNHPQFAFHHHLPPTHVSPGAAMRPRAFV
jgi:hypothetical protein